MQIMTVTPCFKGLSKKGMVTFAATERSFPLVVPNSQIEATLNGPRPPEIKQCLQDAGAAALKVVKKSNPNLQGLRVSGYDIKPAPNSADAEPAD